MKENLPKTQTKKVITAPTKAARVKSFHINIQINSKLKLFEFVYLKIKIYGSLDVERSLERPLSAAQVFFSVIYTGQRSKQSTPHFNVVWWEWKHYLSNYQLFQLRVQRERAFELYLNL